MREKALAAKLRGKDEEIEKLVARRTQELEQKYKEALEALTVDHAGKLKETIDAATAAEAAKNELSNKVKKLEADLEERIKELSTLKGDREKTLHSLAEMQVAVSDKAKQLSSANDTIADLRLKLTTLEKSLEDGRTREKALNKDLQDERDLLKSAAAAQADYEKGVKLWTDRLVDTAERLTAQLSTMGRDSLQGFKYSTEEWVSQSARLTMFFESIIDALKLLQSNRATQLANESRKLCRAILRKVLIKVVHHNPGIDLTNALGRLPRDADLKALEELIAPILEKVDSIKRIEGQRRD